MGKKTGIIVDIQTGTNQRGTGTKAEIHIKLHKTKHKHDSHGISQDFCFL